MDILNQRRILLSATALFRSGDTYIAQSDHLSVTLTANDEPQPPVISPTPRGFNVTFGKLYPGNSTAQAYEGYFDGRRMNLLVAANCVGDMNGRAVLSVQLNAAEADPST